MIANKDTIAGLTLKYACEIALAPRDNKIAVICKIPGECCPIEGNYGVLDLNCFIKDSKIKCPK